MTEAKSGDTVRIHYSGFLMDGTIFDSSVEGEPFEFTLGDGTVIPGFDDAVVGMQEGEEKTLAIPPARAYGDRDEDLVATVDLGQLPPEIEPVVGSILQITSEDGQVSNVIITELTDTTITLDGNHPLAGQELIFEVKLLEVAG
ncbi:MAG: peptidylprolyl isomerase [Nitrospirota bacterium]|jgi:peptidylprolyl isomerase